MQQFILNSLRIASMHAWPRRTLRQRPQRLQVLGSLACRWPAPFCTSHPDKPRTKNTSSKQSHLTTSTTSEADFSNDMATSLGADSAHPNRIWTIPNAMTGTRIILAPAIAFWILDGNLGAAAVAFFVAGALDYGDGVVARKYVCNMQPLRDGMYFVSASC